MIQKIHHEAIRSLLLLALVSGFCSASLPDVCRLSRPSNMMHPCNKTLQERRFFFSSDEESLKFRCKPFGICRDITEEKDPIAGTINYFTSQDDCVNMCTKAVECPELSIDNGLVTQSRRYVGYTARYSCSDGYKLVGTTSRTCLPSGNWSDEAPTCEVQCTPPPLAANSTIQPVQEYYDVGSTVTYRCIEGFSGGGRRDCLDNGQWSGNETECKSENVLQCREPSPIDHGTVIAPDYSVGSMMRYSCDPSYVLVGPSMRICLNDLTWSRPTEKAFCTRLNLTHHGDDVTNKTLSLMEDMGSVDIHCGMSSPDSESPAAPVEWMHADGQPLDGPFIRQNGPYLHFDQVVKNLEDTYICRRGTLMANVQITVVQKHGCMPIERPRIVPVNTALDHEVSQESTLILTCLISGCPSAEVRWYHNGVLLNASDRVNISSDPFFDQLTVYVLTIKGVVPEDEGEYVCEGSNSAGSASLHMASVTVTSTTVKRSVPKRQLRVQRSAIKSRIASLCNLESDTVTVVASVRRPTRKVNKARAYSVDALRTIRGLMHLQSQQQLTTITTDSSVRLKANTKYLLTGRMVDNKLYITDAIVHSKALERDLSSC